jgi:hypothetical protein
MGQLLGGNTDAGIGPASSAAAISPSRGRSDTVIAPLVAEMVDEVWHVPHHCLYFLPSASEQPIGLLAGVSVDFRKGTYDGRDAPYLAGRFTGRGVDQL